MRKTLAWLPHFTKSGDWVVKPIIFHWSACTKPGKWEVTNMFRSIDLLPFRPTVLCFWFFISFRIWPNIHHSISIYIYTFQMRADNPQLTYICFYGHIDLFPGFWLVRTKPMHPACSHVMSQGVFTLICMSSLKNRKVLCIPHGEGRTKF
jgi:hypothetical protein